MALWADQWVTGLACKDITLNNSRLSSNSTSLDKCCFRMMQKERSTIPLCGFQHYSTHGTIMGLVSNGARVFNNFQQSQSLLGRPDVYLHLNRGRRFPCAARSNRQRRPPSLIRGRRRSTSAHDVLLTHLYSSSLFNAMHTRDARRLGLR